MGWEKRGGRRYYYQKHREGDRVISQYVGAGPIADLLADTDEDDRFGNRITAYAAQLRGLAEERIDGLLLQQEILIRKLVAESLAASGFHNHKGEWRLRLK